MRSWFYRVWVGGEAKVDHLLPAVLLAQLQGSVRTLRQDLDISRVGVTAEQEP